MMNHTIHKACILAAGMGTRLRPYTNNTPKPLMKIAGRTLLDRTLDHLKTVGVDEIMINTHYLAAQIQSAIHARDDFISHISHEPELLDTGGGIKNMLTHCGDTFYVLSGDGLWDGDALHNLSKMWDPKSMDILIVLQPIASMILTHGVGDYDIDDDGLPVRSLNQSGQYMFTSMRINHRRIFEDTPDGSFSYLNLLDKAQKQRRLHAVIHDGDWHHISTPDDLEAVDAHYKET